MVIVAAAMLYRDIIISVPKPGRHGDIFYKYQSRLEDDKFEELRNDFIKNGQQGFLTSEGEFVDRIRGEEIARAADQITGEHTPSKKRGTLISPPYLYSEDMW